MATDPFPRLNAAIRRRLLAAAVLLQAEHKRDLSKTFPPASSPGQFPAARTLNLRDSVTVVEIPGGWRIGYLPSVAAYLPVLIRRGRRGIHDTARRIMPRLLKIIGGA